LNSHIALQVLVLLLLTFRKIKPYLLEVGIYKASSNDFFLFLMLVTST